MQVVRMHSKAGWWLTCVEVPRFGSALCSMHVHIVCLLCAQALGCSSDHCLIIWTGKNNACAVRVPLQALSLTALVCSAASISCKLPLKRKVLVMRSVCSLPGYGTKKLLLPQYALMRQHPMQHRLRRTLAPGLPAAPSMHRIAMASKT